MNTRTLLLTLLVASVAELPAVAELAAMTGIDKSIVTTERGPVRGTVGANFRQFLGIPYAAPPVGNLRWRPPREHARWFTPLNATSFGNHCPQVASPFGTASLTEDCLFLNVFTPDEEANHESDSRLYPVMVWIHGGAFTVGGER